MFFVFLDTFTGQSGDTEKPGLKIFLLCFRIRKGFGFIRFGDTFSSTKFKPDLLSSKQQNQ